MAIALWVAQGLLALLFVVAGTMKLTSSHEQIRSRLGSKEALPEWGIRLIGALEIAGAIGLILPMLTGILPSLTPIAAVGLALTMVGAAAWHVRRQELSQVPATLLILALALFVAYGRFVLMPVVG